jgi:Fe(3+) dicitrate transport protein
MFGGIESLIASLFEPFLNPLSRTYWVGLVVSLLITVAYFGALRPSSWTYQRFVAVLKHPSTGLDVQLLIGRQLLRLLIGMPSLVSGWWVATRGVRWLDGAVGVPQAPALSGGQAAILYTIVLFVAWDLSRFVLHWLMHRVPFLWAFHQVHHSAEVITPLTFHRIHPIESWLYDLRGALVTGTVAGSFYWLFRGSVSDLTLLGVPAIGFVCNVLTGNLRHSHVWLRFPPMVERWLISPAQHQLHHSLEPSQYNGNYGTWLAIWDRVLGSLIISDTPPVAYGIPAAERNHGNDLLSAWFGPVRRVFLPGALMVFMLLGSLARAAEADGTEDEGADLEAEEEAVDFSRFGEEIFVTGEDEPLREAGSAHVVDEAALEILELDNIERVLAWVPGISTRGEDGFGLRPNIGIRGANSDRSAKVTLMEDGVLLAPAPYAAPAAYYFPMSTRLTGVEVFKGAASTRYGPQTVGGAINVLTRPIPDQLEGYSDLSLGLRSSYKAHAWSGLRHEKLGVLLEGVHLVSKGFKELDTGGPTGFSRTEMMLKSDLEVHPAHRLKLKLGYARELSHETYLGLTESDWEETPYRRYAASELGLMQWDRTQVVLEWVARPQSSVKVRTVAYHHWLSRAWTKLNGFSDGQDLHELLRADPDSGQGAVYLAILRGDEDSSPTGQSLQIGTNDRQFHSFGLQSMLRWKRYGERLSSAFEAGLRLHADDVRRLHTEDPFAMTGGRLTSTGDPTETLQNSHATARALAAYVHEDLSVDRLHFFPSARLEIVRSWRDDEGDPADEVGLIATPPAEPLTRAAVLPGFGSLFAFDDWTDLFVGVHRGFSPVVPGQPEEVRPEHSWNYEGGIRRSLGDLQAELVGFFNDYQNLTGQCTLSGGCTGDDLDRQFNGGAVHVYGLEVVGGIGVKLAPGLSLPLDAIYTLTQSQFMSEFTSSFPQFGSVDVGDSLPYVARHQAGLGLGVESLRLRVRVGLSYRSELLDIAGDFSEAQTLPSLLLLDAGAKVLLTQQWSLYFTGTNLTNSTAITSWRPFGARPTAPLQVMGGIKWGAQP